MRAFCEMKQAHLIAPKTIVWREASNPQPGRGELLVRVRAALTCGTDLKTYRRGHPKLGFGPFGHEASGDVVAAGEGVTEFAPGDAVMWVQTAPCNACARCKDGRENLCENLFETIALGAYADYVLLPARVVACNVYPKPAALSYIEAAFLEPLACVVHGWNSMRRADAAQPQPRTAAVSGTGTIGLLHIALSARAGVRVTAVGRRQSRLALARELGAAETIHADDLQSAARPQTARFDAAVECAGTAEAWQQAVALVKAGGRALFFSGLAAGEKVALDAERLHYDEVTCLGSFHFTPADVGQARDLLVSGSLNVRSLISGVEPLDALVDVFERLDRHQGDKFALLPGGRPPQWL